MERKKYQVFISSTYTDLISERNAVTQCLLDNDCIPVGMEQFPASNMSQMDYIKRMLDDCDYYVLILAGRYGSVDDSGMGYTEKEYDYAVSCGIPIMSFVIKDINSLTMAQCESDKKLFDKLIRFRNKVCTGKLVKFYSNADELKGHVAASIYKCIHDFPARGWIRGPESGIATRIDIGESKIIETDNHSGNSDSNFGKKQTMPLYLSRKEMVDLLKCLYSSIMEYVSGINNGIQEYVNRASYNMEKYVESLYTVTDVYYDPNSIEGTISEEIVHSYNIFVEAVDEFIKTRHNDGSINKDAAKQTEKALANLRRGVAAAIRRLDK